MQKQRSPGANRGPATDTDLCQEVRDILAEAVEEPWVRKERKRLEQARIVRQAWLSALALHHDELTPDEALRVCQFGAMVEKSVAP